MDMQVSKTVLGVLSVVWVLSGDQVKKFRSLDQIWRSGSRQIETLEFPAALNVRLGDDFLGIS